MLPHGHSFIVTVHWQFCFLFVRWGVMTSQSTPPSPSCAPASARPVWRSRTWRSRCCVAAITGCKTGLLSRPPIKRWARHRQTLSQSVPSTLFCHKGLIPLPAPSLLCPALLAVWNTNWACCTVFFLFRLTFPRGHFPRLAECAHFHYENVDFGNVQVSS